MKNFIKYFIENKRLNYVLLFFIAYIGIVSYIKIPKEMFPEMELQKINIIGSYAGTSSDNMDKMAVRDIEKSVIALSGVDKTESIITPGSFSITLTLNESSNKINLLNKVKDEVSKINKNLPQDMNEPTVTLVDQIKPVLSVSIASSLLTRDQLIDKAKEIEAILLKVKGVSDIDLRGDSDKQISIRLNNEKIKAYNLNYNQLISALSNLSYTFPVGNIEEKGNYVFITTNNGKSDIEKWKDILLKINDKYIKLKDIAEIKEIYPETKTVSSFNSKNNLTLVISKSKEDDSIKLSKDIKNKIMDIEKNYPDLDMNIFNDTSKKIKFRLDTVISNLMFGLILVYLSMYFLINARIAFVVSMGIPFSFLIGISFIYFLGYSINIISLLGALIVIGIVVDDAIVVTENIQRYIDDGLSNKEAAIKGTTEMVLPITLATLTTVVAFLPIFMLHGEIGLFLILIPIMTIMILLGSLVESFLFLPLHAEEILRKSKKETFNWKPLQDAYEKTLHKIIKYKKTFLIFFLIFIPLLTLGTLKTMNFQFFAPFDGTNLYISGKLNINTPLSETQKIATKIENEFLKNKDEFFIKTTSVTSGYRKTLAGIPENNNNVFYITIEMYDQVPNNIFDKYINPILNFNFDFNNINNKRTEKSIELAKKATKLVEKIKDKYNIEEIGVLEDKAGLVKSDIKISFHGNNKEDVDNAVELIYKKLKNMDSIKSVGNNIELGKNEYKLDINKYGESLGVTEKDLGLYLSSSFLDKKISTTYGDFGVVDINILDRNKDDIDNLLNFNIQLKDGKVVKLKNIVNISKYKNYAKIEKLNGTIIKNVFANVNNKMTAGQVLDLLQDDFKDIKNNNIKISFLGEEEKKEQLKADMKNAAAIAFFLIVISLLLIFSKLKYVIMVISIIPLSMLGALIGHKLLGINLTMPSVIGMLGLAGVVINDAIIMLDFLHGTRDSSKFFERAKLRLRPILITSITTFLGMFTLIFYASGEAVILQPIAISIGFGLLWGTILTLFYIPTLYAVLNNVNSK